MKRYYLGSFPPPYGGVTIKNRLVYSNIIKYIDCNMIDFSQIKEKKIKTLFKFILAITNRKAAFVIGVSGDSTRKKFTQLLYTINRTAMRKSIILIMGGIAHNTISSDDNYKTWMKEFKMIYVETESMMQTLNRAGLNNVKVFPNCRENPNFDELNKQKNDLFRCVYFSRISKDKGVDTIIDTCERLSINGFQYHVDLYGKIDEDYKDEFTNKISNNAAISYKGIFKSEGNNVYHKLQEYDVMLFPTRWKAEGVPGILIESKIASLPVIASNINFNSEIVNHGVDGIVINPGNSEELYNSIVELYNNPDSLSKMSQNAKKSSEKYYIDNYIDEIVDLLQERNHIL